MKIKLFFCAVALFATVGSAAAGTLELEAKETAPPTITQSEPWHFNLASPGWLASLSGEVGLRGVNTDVDVDFGKIIRQVKGIASFSHSQTLLALLVDYKHPQANGRGLKPMRRYE